MKHLLLTAVAIAIALTGAQAQHINSRLPDCIKTYGAEIAPAKETNYGNCHFFRTNEMSIVIVTNCTKVKEIRYRKLSGDEFSKDEIDILQLKNREGILGGGAYEWEPILNAPDGIQAWSLSREGKAELQAYQKDTGKEAYINAFVPDAHGGVTVQATKKTDYELVIRTWAQIAVDIEGNKQDSIDKLGNL